MAKESKRDRFVRIAEARTNKILQMVRLVGNLSKRGTYEYTPEDVEKIFGAIETEVAAAKEKFFKPDGRKRFTLGGTDNGNNEDQEAERQAGTDDV